MKSSIKFSASIIADGYSSRMGNYKGYGYTLRL